MQLSNEQKSITIDALSAKCTIQQQQIECLRNDNRELQIKVEDNNVIHTQAIALERKAVSCLLEDNNKLREQISNLETANKILSVCIDGFIKDIKQMNEDNQNLKCFIGLMKYEIKPKTGGINGI